MNQQEQQTVERTIKKINETITELMYQKTELEMRITELNNMKSELLILLPIDKRIDNLFS